MKYIFTTTFHNLQIMKLYGQFFIPKADTVPLDT